MGVLIASKSNAVWLSPGVAVAEVSNLALLALLGEALLGVAFAGVFLALLGVALAGVFLALLGVALTGVFLTLLGVALATGVFFALLGVALGVALAGVALAGVALAGVALAGVTLAGVVFLALLGVALAGVAALAGVFLALFGVALAGDFEGVALVGVAFFTLFGVAFAGVAFLGVAAAALGLAGVFIISAKPSKLASLVDTFLAGAFLNGVLRPFFAKTGVLCFFLEIVMFSGDKAWLAFLVKSKLLGTSYKKQDQCV